MASSDASIDASSWRASASGGLSACDSLGGLVRGLAVALGDERLELGDRFLARSREGLGGGTGGWLHRLVEGARRLLHRELLCEDGVQEIGVVCLRALLQLVGRAACRQGERCADGRASGDDHAAAGDPGGVGAAAHRWEKIP